MPNHRIIPYFNDFHEQLKLKKLRELKERMNKNNGESESKEDKGT